MGEMKERILREEMTEIVVRKLYEQLPGLTEVMTVAAQMYPVAFTLTVEKSYERANYYLKMEEEIRGAAEKKREEELLKEAIRNNEEELERQAIERKRKKRRIGRRTLKKKALETQRDFGLIKRKKK